MSDSLNEIIYRANEHDEQSAKEGAEPETFEDVDLSVLLDFEAAQCEGEPDLIVELIDLYLADVPPQLAAIKDFISTADEISLKRAAHNLKGSSANLGVDGIARLCEELEQTDFIESSQKMNVCVNRLEQAFARVRTVFLAERRNRA